MDCSCGWRRRTYVPTTTHMPTPPMSQLTNALQSSARNRRNPLIVNHLKRILKRSKNDVVPDRSLIVCRKQISLRSYVAFDLALTPPWLADVDVTKAGSWRDGVAIEGRTRHGRARHGGQRYH